MENDNDNDNDKLHLVTDADRDRDRDRDRQWLRSTVEEARYGTEEITEEERQWLDRVTRQVGGLAQVAVRQREVINKAVGDWEGDLWVARERGWMALWLGLAIGLALGAALWLAGKAVGQ